MLKIWTTKKFFGLREVPYRTAIQIGGKMELLERADDVKIKTPALRSRITERIVALTLSVKETSGLSIPRRLRS